MSLPDLIERIDKLLFIYIHNDSNSAVLDSMMLLIRNQYTWVFLYVFLLTYVYLKAKKVFWVFILFSLATFALCDSISAAFLKPLLGRVRPCHDPEVQAFVRNLLDCGGIYSFPSSHAANHFGLATFWFIFFQKINHSKWSWLFVWAAIIGYAQVYVGKHYPLDIVAGAMLGLLLGLGIGRIFQWTLKIDFNTRKSIFPA
jgi:membrane-associated phospholipid phosphatase